MIRLTSCSARSQSSSAWPTSKLRFSARKYTASAIMRCHSGSAGGSNEGRMPLSEGILFEGILLEGILFEGILFEGILFEGILFEGILFEGILFEGILFEGIFE